MRFSGFVVSSSRFLLSTSLFILLVSPVGIAGGASEQKEKPGEQEKVIREVKRSGGSSLVIQEYTLIPEATEECTAEEADWWSRFRQAGNALYKKGDQKAIKKFYLLMLEGVEKQYRIPLKDRGPQLIRITTPTYLEMARKSRMEGYVEMSVEYRADGSVGDVKVTKELGAGLDEEAVRAARQAVFLPAIKNGAFATSWVEAKVGFDLAGGKKLEPPSPPKEKN